MKYTGKKPLKKRGAEFVTKRGSKQLAIWLTVISFVGIFFTSLIYFKPDLLAPFVTINNQALGVFGDFIGGFFGTLLSLAAVFLIWLTYKAQKKEFRAMKVVATKQNFEATLFKLIDNFNDCKKGISISESNLPVTLKDANDIFSIDHNPLYQSTYAISIMNFQIYLALNTYVYKNDIDKLNYRFVEEVNKEYVELLKEYGDRNDGQEISEEDHIKLIVELLFSQFSFYLNQYFNIFYVVSKLSMGNLLTEDTTNDFYKTVIKAQLIGEEIDLLTYRALIDENISSALEFLDILPD